MADTDILLSVDLDTKNALQTAKELGKEVEKSINSQKESSPQMTSFNAQLKQATIEAERLGKQLEQLSTKKIPTAEYTEIEKRLQKNNAQFDKLLIKQDEMQETGQDFGKAWEKLNVQMEQLGTLIREDEADLKQLVASGKAFTLGKDSAEYTKIETQLDKVNDKTKLLLMRKKELAQKEAGIGGEGESGGGMAGMVASIATGASKSLMILKAVGKVLKKTLLTVAAVTLGVRGIMGIIRRIRRMVIDGFKAVYEGDTKLKKQVDDLKNSWAEVKANLTAAFLPIIEMAIPYIQKLLDWVNLLLSKLSMFIAAIAGQNAYAKAIKKTGDAAASANKQLSKFDELNNLSSGGAAGSEFDIQQLPIDKDILDKVEKLKKLLNEIKNYFKENVFEPFKEGFTSAVGDLPSKIAVIRENLESIKDSLIEIFTDPEVQEAQKNYTQAFSKLAGEATGLFVNVGVNIGEAVTGGVEDFLKENKDEIKQDLVDTMTLQTEDVDKMSGVVDAISKIVDQIGESEPLVKTISNLLSTVYDLLMTIEQTAVTVLGLLLDLFGPMITENVDNFKGLLESLFTTFEKISGFIASVASTIKGVIVPLFQALSPLFSAVGQILADLVAKVIELWTVGVAPILNQVVDDITTIWNDYIDPILKDVVAVITDVIAIISPLITWLWESILKPVVDWIIGTIAPLLFPIFDQLWSVVVSGIKLILGWIKMMFDTLKAVVHFIKSILTGDVQGAVDSVHDMLQAWFDWIFDIFAVLMENLARGITNIIQIFTGVWNFLKGFVSAVLEMFTSIVNGFETVIDNVRDVLIDAEGKWKGFWSNLVLSVINAFNNIINKINEMLGNIFGRLDELGIGEWLKDKFNINVPKTFTAIQTISTIPALAQGTVIPPSMGDFIARLGDNNQETEVVSPLSTMKQAMIEAMQQMGGFGGDINVELTVDGNVLARTVVKQNDLYRRQTGKSLLTT